MIATLNETVFNREVFLVILANGHGRLLASQGSFLIRLQFSL